MFLFLILSLFSVSPPTPTAPHTQPLIVSVSVSPSESVLKCQALPQALCTWSLWTEIVWTDGFAAAWNKVMWAVSTISSAKPLKVCICRSFLLYLSVSFFKSYFFPSPFILPYPLSPPPTPDSPAITTLLTVRFSNLMPGRYQPGF